MASRIPVPSRRDNARTGKRQVPGSPLESLPGPSTTEQPVTKRLRAGPAELRSSKQPTCTNGQLLWTGPSSSSLPGLSSAEQPTDDRLVAQQTNIACTDGRQTGHHFAHSVAKGNSRVHYGDNYNATHHHNYQRPDPDHRIPRSLEDAIARNRVEMYLDHVMESLSFERMGLRKGTIAPALVNTCQWLLTSPEYISWRNPDQIDVHHGFMWIKSKAGAGKSTTMKFLLESTRSQHSGDTVISFFFNARGDEMEKTLNGLYRHLLHQILSTVSRLKYGMVDDINETAYQGWQLQPLKDLLRRAVLDLQSERFTCFIDALDETSEDEIRELIDFFEELGNDVVAKNISFRVCFSSRHYPNVKLEICQYLNLDNKREHENDIALYIRSKLKPQRGGISDSIPALVLKKAQGVFLWVVLVTQILKRDYDRGDIHKAHSRLESIPPGLHSLFYDMIHRNVEDPDDNKYLLSLLLWIAFARHPLTPQDLYYAVRSEDADLDISQLLQTNDVNLETMKLFILNCSKGLAELTTTRRRRPTVQFIHESVRDFLNETGFDILTPGRGTPLLGFAHNNLKQCCLRWISYTISKQPVTRTFYSDTPLISYSIGHIIEHAEQACRSGIPQEDFVENFPAEVWTLLERRATGWDKLGELYASPASRTEILACAAGWYMPGEPYASPVSLTEILTSHNAKALLAIELERIGPRLLSCQYETALRTAMSHSEMTIFRLLLHKASPSHSSVEEQAKTVLYAVEERYEEALRLMSIYGKHFVPPCERFALTLQAACPEYAGRPILGYMRMMSKAKFTIEPVAQARLFQACMQGIETPVQAYLEGKSNFSVTVNDLSRSPAVYPRAGNPGLQMPLGHNADLDAAQGRSFYPVLLEDWTRYSSPTSKCQHAV